MPDNSRPVGAVSSAHSAAGAPPSDAHPDVAMTVGQPRPDTSADFGMTLPASIRPSGPQRFGKYEVVSELGEGGMGRVYKAVDTELGREVAVKVLRSSDPFEANRFRGEAEMIAALDHPNIVKVFDIATPPDGRPYLVLELCEGGSLDHELAGHPVEPRAPRR